MRPKLLAGREAIEIGVDIATASNLPGDNVRREGSIGGAVATVSKGDPAVRHPGDLPDDRQAGGRLAERPRPGKLDSRVELRQEPMQFALQCCGLSGQQIFATA